MLYWGATAYIAVGLYLVFVSPFRKIIRADLAETPIESGAGRWKLALARVIICVVAFMLWPVFLVDWFRQRQSDWLRNDGISLGELGELSTGV